MNVPNQPVAVTGSAPGTIDAALDEYLGQQTAPVQDNAPAPSEAPGVNDAAPDVQSPEPVPDTPPDVAPEPEPAGGDDFPPEPEPVAAEALPTITIYPDGPNGAPVEITAEEAQNSYMRQADYTRKTQELAQQRQEAEYYAQQVNAQREEYLQGMQTVGQIYAAQEPPMPDPSLQEADPVAYLEQVENVRAHRDRMAALQARHAQTAQYQQQAQTQAMAGQLQHAKEQLVHMMPELSNPESMTAFVTKNRAHLVSNGFTEQEANNVYDWRAAVYIDKARRYDEMMAKSAGKIAAAPKTNTPTIRQSQTAGVPAGGYDANVLKKAEQRLSQTGSIDAGIDVLIARRGT